MSHLKIISVVTRYSICASRFRYSDVTAMLWRRNSITRECTVHW